MALQQTVQDLLSLLDKVKNDDANILTLNRGQGNTLVQKLREVADLVEGKLKLNNDGSTQIQDIPGRIKRYTSPSQNIPGGSEGGARPMVKKRRSYEQEPPQTDGDEECTDTNSDKEGSIGELEVDLPLVSAPNQADSASLETQLHPNTQRTPEISPHSRSQPVIHTDEHAKKRRRLVKNMVKKLDKFQSHSCGIIYQGDPKEKEYVDNFKCRLRRHLPDLKNNKHCFHYMMWATRETFECDYCRKCPNAVI